jgi:hypothetical protein
MEDSGDAAAFSFRAPLFEKNTNHTETEFTKQQAIRSQRRTELVTFSEIGREASALMICQTLAEH